MLAMQRAIRFSRRVEHRHVARRDRTPAASALPRGVLLRAMAMGMETSAVEKGLIDSDELAAGHALRPGKPVAHVMTQDDLGQPLTRGSFFRPPSRKPRFKPGDRVRARNINPPTHTRLPRYARGHEGVIEAVRGCHVFPDSVTTGAARIRSGFTLWFSTAASSGAPMPIRR